MLRGMRVISAVLVLSFFAAAAAQEEPTPEEAQANPPLIDAGAMRADPGASLHAEPQTELDLPANSLARFARTPPETNDEMEIAAPESQTPMAIDPDASHADKPPQFSIEATAGAGGGASSPANPVSLVLAAALAALAATSLGAAVKSR